MGILGKAIAYKVVKNRAERKAEERILKELNDTRKFEAEVCRSCDKPRSEHVLRDGDYYCID